MEGEDSRPPAPATEDRELLERHLHALARLHGVDYHKRLSRWLRVQTLAKSLHTCVEGRLPRLPPRRADAGEESAVRRAVDQRVPKAGRVAVQTRHLEHLNVGDLVQHALLDAVGEGGGDQRDRAVRRQSRTEALVRFE
eukprot:2172866-Pleurochrysis_carterae.AAC.7